MVRASSLLCCRQNEKFAGAQEIGIGPCKGYDGAAVAGGMPSLDVSVVPPLCQFERASCSGHPSVLGKVAYL